MLEHPLKLIDIISDRLLLVILNYFSKSNLKKLQNDTANAAKVQTKVLMDILKLQKDTDYGKRYKFSEIKSVKDFRKAHPISTYQDYQDIINNIANTGKFNQLVAEPIILFQETSGTTGKGKLIPRTKRLFSAFQKVIQAVVGLTESYYLNKNGNTNNCRGLTLSNAQPLKLTPSGIPRGAGSSGGIKQSKFIQTIIRLKYTSPPSVFLIS
ncbi:MAG: GH3 auxin-responsive promoter family protein, partial [Moorea sp. SIO4E2]